MKIVKILSILTVIIALTLLSIGSVSATVTLEDWCNFCISEDMDDDVCYDVCSYSPRVLTYHDGDYEYTFGVDSQNDAHYRSYSYQNLRDRMYKPFRWVAIPTEYYGMMPMVDMQDFEENQPVQHVQVVVPAQTQYEQYTQPASGYGVDDNPVDTTGRELRQAPETGKIYYGEDMKSNFFNNTWLVVLYLIIAFIVLILIVYAIFRLLLRA